MEPAHIPHYKGEQGWGLAGHLTVNLVPVDALAAYQAKPIPGALPSAVPVSPLAATIYQLPARNRKKTGIWTLWCLWFNTYRKLFTFVVALNAAGIALAAFGYFPYAEKWTSAMALGNLNCAILMRNELFGRFLYLFVNACFAKWPPLWWRLGCTSILQHLGGIHSGCALSGTGWLILKVVNIFRNHSVNNISILVVGAATNVAIIIKFYDNMMIYVGQDFYSVFERLHRFVGWIALILTWAFTISEDLYNTNTWTWNSVVEHIVRQQDFCFVVGMTTFTIIPWLCVREVPVDIELPSSKVAVIRFKRGMQQGLLGRISRSSIMEYHAFGIISEGTHAEYHYMVCDTLQGDFTRSLVNDPPRTLWTRQLKFAGVSNTSTLYKRGVRFCTGTGIGAALSTCLQSPDWFLIWIGSDQEKTFGPQSALEGGRPDTMRVLKKVYNCWGAEVVFITSNYEGNSRLMQGCKEAGIPAFGTLWDFVGVAFATCWLPEADDI
ncbi:hypothetical protein BJV77DRAFT_1064468 [Russula vinacea]|nr:hypothetical protein BJV77DRAFT_1064468 [Russula vinacea]